MHFDVAIIGGGIAGLTTAIHAAKTGKVALLSKTYIMRSHSIAAQGGINAVLQSTDHVENHIKDTIKAAAGLGNSKAAKRLCKNAKTGIRFLQTIGVHFSTKDGKIDQRLMAGQSHKRTCYSKDHTGHAIMQQLYFKAISDKNITLLEEKQVIDIKYSSNESQKKNNDKNEKQQTSLFSKIFKRTQLTPEPIIDLAYYDFNDGLVDSLTTNNIVFATGGYGSIYKTTSNGAHSTGDGHILARKIGAALQNMELVQFHPTGIYERGLLISESVRGYGAHLLNRLDRRFMIKYSKKEELAPRDVITKAITEEINHNRGIHKKDYVHMDLRHIYETTKENIPHIIENIKFFTGLNPEYDLIPIAPTAHYSMGGIATTEHSNILNKQRKQIKNAYAVGECACNGLHGANRLGGNSVLEALIFGMLLGQELADKLEKQSKKLKKISNPGLEPEYRIGEDTKTLQQINRKKIFTLIQRPPEHTNVFHLMEMLKKINSKYLGVEKDAKGLDTALHKIEKIKLKAKTLALNNTTLEKNTELQAFYQLLNMIETSLAVCKSAISRTETRGSHIRTDFPKQKEPINSLY